jgi:putative ABC transport system substrate-binding protein
VNRRDLIVLVASAAALACTQAARAQQAAKVYRIGFLGDSPAAFSERTEAFRQGLRDLGYVEGRNITIEYRWAHGNPEQMREFVEELVRLKVDVIIVPSSIYTEAAKRATSTIPIVFVGHAEPVATGHVTSLARPGGNITGHSVMMTETSVKGLELFKQAVPGLARVAVIWDPATPSHTPTLKAVEDAGPLLGLHVHPVAVHSATEFDSAFLAIVQARADSVMVLTTPLFITGAQRLAELALTHKLPSLFGPKYELNAGGLMSYWPDALDTWRRSAIYVDKILKGAKPADLPVQQPTRFELVINLKTAKALGLTVPQSFLMRADEVIE